ncbi:hypothetical protein DV515_00005635 [Chloebia gouldiae]|uniref:Uncharacterized protein n=1 Tax=Chloebia gouldiae TaxID=44316 RepID=A0A3L8SN81_CHLGU|nr:hypothetical protein DV515_00005635 [Chloebia gouldiae]
MLAFTRQGFGIPEAKFPHCKYAKLMCSDPQVKSVKDLSTVTATETRGKEHVQLSGLAKTLAARTRNLYSRSACRSCTLKEVLRQVVRSVHVLSSEFQISTV